MALIEAPLPFGSAASRWFYVLINELELRGHSLTIYCACSFQHEMEKAKEIYINRPLIKIYFYLFPSKRSIFDRIKGFIRPYSYMFSHDFIHSWNQEIKKNYDIIHLEQTWSGHLKISDRNKALINTHHFISIDLEDRANHTFSEKCEYFKIYHTEKRIMKKFKHIRACSLRLKNKIETWHPNKNSNDIVFVPVGIDSTLYPFISFAQKIIKNDMVVSLIASLHWSPGKTAALRLIEEIWPLIKRELPKAKLQIIGWNARKVLRQYLEQPDILIEENVKEIRPYFENSSLLLYAPKKGSGMKIKILESMLLGVPVVTNLEGVEGLDVENGVHAFLSEKDDELAKKAVLLLLNPKLQEEMAIKARLLIESQCSPQVTVDRIIDKYRSMLAQEKI